MEGQVTDPSKAITDKKKHVKVDFLKSDGSILFSWDAQQALLTGYSHSGSDAASNAVLTVTVDDRRRRVAAAGQQRQSDRGCVTESR